MTIFVSSLPEYHVMTRTERLFQLMQSMRSAVPPVKAEMLAQDLGVSPRTIYRDIDTLRGLGAVIDGEAGFGYTLIEDNALPPMTFDDDEIEALVLGLREVSQIGDPALASAALKALSKLKARLPPRQSHRLEHAVLSARRFRPREEPGVDAGILRKATWDEVTVAFDYVDKAGQATQRQVDPLGIAMLDHVHCLLTWCHLRKDFRSFRLDRMRNLDVSTHSFRPRRVPLLREFLTLLRQDADASANPRTTEN